VSTDPRADIAAADDLYAYVPSAAVLVLGWRLEQLCAAGYDGETAIELALNTEIDLHRAVSLLHRGCPAETARRILT
jgi:hypothetical protein